MPHNGDAWNRFLPGPGATFLHQESRGAVRASCRARHRFVYVLKPTSRARQESPMSTPITRQRIPSHGDISHCCLLKSCHYIAPFSSVNEFWKIPRWATPRNFSGVCETCAIPPPIVWLRASPQLTAFTRRMLLQPWNQFRHRRRASLYPGCLTDFMFLTYDMQTLCDIWISPKRIFSTLPFLVFFK